MTEILGVEINLSKSLISSNGTFEFAKRLIRDSDNLSSVGPKNIALALRAPAHISTVLLDYVSKGGSLIGTTKDKIYSLTSDIVKISKGNYECLL